MKVLIEILIVVLATILGAIYSKYYLTEEWLPIGIVIGFCVGLIVVYIIRKIVESNFSTLIGVTVGASGGIVASWFVFSVIPSENIKPEILLVSRIFVMLVFSYFGGLIGLKIVDFVSGLQIKGDQLKGGTRINVRSVKILDTSAIIDGRIADICETGFMDCVLAIPTFVLKELQDLADSHDPFLRNKGRRGFDIIKRLKSCPYVSVKLISVDFPDLKEVDAKLIKLAKKMKASIITTDYNLSQVAKLQGVDVLNVNDLSKAVKPIVIPGEELDIFVMKPGKEPKQGVGHLDDGTMVVIEDGRPYIGKKVRIVVTNLLQTSTGRIIFGRVKSVIEEDRKEMEGLGEGVEV